MSVIRNITGSALCMAAALVVANAAHAQTAPAAPAAAPKAQAPSVDSVFNRWDKDKNKVLSQEEFKAGWNEVQMANAIRKLRANFVAMDVNKSGGLEANEYANLELIKRSKAPPMMSAFDADKSQRLEFKEYVSLVNSMMANSKP